MILSVVITLLVILLISYTKFKGNIARPSILFTSGIFLACCMAFFFRQEWNLNSMNPTTIYFLIGGSVVAFILDSLFCKNTKPLVINESPDFISAKNSRLRIFILIQLISYALYANAKVANLGYAVALAQALGQLNEMVKFDDFDIYIPWYANVPFAFCQSLGYVWAILIPIYVRNKAKKSTIVLIIANYALSIVGCMLSGGRMPVLIYLVPLAIFFILYNISNNESRIKTLTQYIKIAVAALIFILVFDQMGNLIGRDERDESVVEIIAEYCGAEIKNLDSFIENPPHFNNKGMFGAATFWKLYNGISSRLGTSQSPYDFNTLYPFNSVNGYHLGNVYTCYGNFYLDFGIGGLFFVALMIFLCCLFYKKMCNSYTFITGIPNVWCFLFANFSGLLFLEFFHEQFFAIDFESLIRKLIYVYFAFLFLYGRKVKLNFWNNKQ